ncbi:TPA: divalent metal cation transporter [Staphylococcus aureus]|nr:divalent metal cation transporter [Staphylococcus aureus]
MGRNLKLKKESDFEFTKNHKRLLLGSVFLMATSAIGPAFLTQTAVFTSQFFASFAFAILLSIIIDIGAQINIWRILVVTGLRGQEISNKVVPGLGTVISILIAFGGLAFNIGNIAGAGLGLNAIFGLDVKWGAAITAIFAILIFVSKSGQKIMDVVSMILGIVMILVVAYVMFVSNPPYGDAFVHTFAPEHPMKLVLPIITLVGGTVGGYITFAGAHRILDSGIKGKQYLPFVNQSAIGSAYTSATFLKTLHKSLNERSNLIVIVFIVISTMIFLFIGKPISLLIIAGAINGWILPITLGAILIASKKKSIVGDYKHPNWMFIFGIVAVLVTILTGIFSFKEVLQLF